MLLQAEIFDLSEVFFQAHHSPAFGWLPVFGSHELTFPQHFV